MIINQRIISNGMEIDKHLGLRIVTETHDKLRILAEYDGLSIKGEVLFLFRQAIRQHEQEYKLLNT